MKRFCLLLAAAVLAAPLSHAADQMPRWFRYYNAQNQPTVTDTITTEHVTRGYDELNASMQMIRRVPAQKTLTPEELAAARAKREAEALRAREDKQLLRLYSRPQDAELACKRQIDALQLRIDFNTSMLTNLRQRRTDEAKRAAIFERTGKPVPADLKESIATYDKQIEKAQAEVQAGKAEQDKIRADFAPIIQRLVELTGKPATLPAKAAPPAAGTATATRQ